MKFLNGNDRLNQRYKFFSLNGLDSEDQSMETGIRTLLECMAQGFVRP